MKITNPSTINFKIEVDDMTKLTTTDVIDKMHKEYGEYIGRKQEQYSNDINELVERTRMEERNKVRSKIQQLPLVFSNPRDNELWTSFKDIVIKTLDKEVK